MNQLPDEIFLKVFENLDSDEISRISSVCKRWYKLCLDSSLWANVKMHSHHSQNAQLKKLIRSKLGAFTHGLTVLHLGSYGLTPDNGDPKPLPRIRLGITADVMRLLATTCPHLTELGLAYCNLGRSFPQHLPETLTEITLVSCLLPVVLPSPQQPPVRLTQLRRLSIYWAVSVTQALLSLLSPARGLRCLELVNCPRLNVASVERICSQFPLLESLALPGINVLVGRGVAGSDSVDLAMSGLIHRLPELRRCNLSWLCGQDTAGSRVEGCVDRVFRCLLQTATRLRCLACPRGLSPDVLAKMAGVPSLRLVCCSSPPPADRSDIGQLRFASLETYYRLNSAHFYHCGLDMFLALHPLDP